MRILAILFILLGIHKPVLAQKAPTPPMYTREWKRVDSLVAKGLPKSAQTIANRVYTEAKTQQNYPQVAKAALYRMILRTFSDENAYVELVTATQRDIRETPEPARSVMQSVLAEIYWQYFQQNRYKFYRRTPIAPKTTPTDTTNDFRTWDAQQLVGAATSGFLASVENWELLQKIPLARYETLIVKGDSSSRPLRPTLFDLLAHRAIDFFKNTEPDLLKPIYAFHLDNPAYLAPPDTFAKLTIQSRDSLSGQYQALRLFQQLIAFHLNDVNPAALADVDAERLVFTYTHETAFDKDQQYRRTLERQITHYQNQPAEADYGYLLADFLADHARNQPKLETPEKITADSTKWNRKQATDICRALVKRFPTTLPGQRAASLLTRLTTMSMNLDVERVTVPDKPFRVLVSYQNVAGLRYRIMRMSMSDNLAYTQEFRQAKSRAQVLSKWLKQAAITEKSIVLPNDGDMNPHTVELPLDGLALGQYLLLATAEETFEKQSAIQAVPFTVSNLGYLASPLRSKQGERFVLVTDRTIGQPLPDVGVQALNYDAVNLQNSRVGSKTNADGRVNIPKSTPSRSEAVRYLLTIDRDTLLTDTQYLYEINPDEAERPETHVALFTDRAIYRPGQLIYVKGLSYSGVKNQYAVKAGENVLLQFRDANEQLVNEQTLTTNEFGTFVATFTAPTGKLTGSMSLATPNGEVSIRVEEYKRPTFEVKANPVKQLVKLGQSVSLTANARTYVGAAVNGAPVRYRITRQLQPRWLGWYGYRGGADWNRAQTEIANGTTTTDDKGQLTVAFTAIPDLEQNRNNNPIFDFTVIIDVTDQAGETRSTTQTLYIGYTVLKAELGIPQQVSIDSASTFPVRITNQLNKPITARAQVTIYCLQTPRNYVRERLWTQPDRNFLSRTEFEKLFPIDEYGRETDPRTWTRGTAVQQQAVNSPTDSLVRLNLKQYLPGTYKAELTVTDSSGETIQERVFFTVVDRKNPTASALATDWLQFGKTTVEPGEQVRFWVGNRQPGYVWLQVEENRTMVRGEWLKTDGKPRLITIPITEKQRGGFAVHLTMVQNGRLYQKSQVIRVPFTNKQLTIETRAFRSKLKPSEREEWTLTVKGLDKTPAEVVATLYDASLDAFEPLDWPTTFYQSYYPVFASWNSESFRDITSQQLIYSYTPQGNPPVRQYDNLGWLGYTFTPQGNRLFRYNSITGWGEDIKNLRITISRTGQTIAGTVTDAKGQGVEGIMIILEGTATTATTNETGKFSLTVPSKDKSVNLLFSCLDYQAIKVSVGQKKRTVTMLPDVHQLQEVVVTGYTTQKRRDLTGVAMATPGTKFVRPTLVADEELREAAAPPAVEELRDAVAAEKVSSDPNAEEVVGAPFNKPIATPRRNFNETAFFIPQQQTDKQGNVMLKFTMPDALTRWRFLAFAHTKDLKTGSLEREIVTQKELTITTNAPRFLREGDTIRVQARVTNLSDRPIYGGTATLQLTNTLTGEPLTNALRMTGNSINMLAPTLSQAIGWTIVVPRNVDAITFRASVMSGTFIDGEEFSVPVLPNRMLVTDSKPFWVNTKETRNFILEPLAKLNPELPSQHERLTVEVTSNPGWYALQALPYLMEYPYECTEQLFSRLYANSLAAHILNSNPAYRTVLSEWQKARNAGPPPVSPLEKNPELKTVALENSPWLADARSETEQQQKLVQLLDKNRLESEQFRAISKLEALQTESGGFQWFGGMLPDFTMTLHVLSGLGHLQKLGVTFSEDVQQRITAMQTKAIAYVDGEMKRQVEAIRKADAGRKVATYPPDYSITQYLYARSFYPKTAIDKASLNYLKQQTAKSWLRAGLQSQALSAMALYRFGDVTTAQSILASLREHSKQTDELGLYWPDNVAGLRWYQAPIETQALLIEAFGEISPDTNETDAMRQWLLRQKQTQSWPSTKATTEAIYALLLRGTDWTSAGVSTQVSLGGKPIEERVTKADAITGYEKVTYSAGAIKPEMGKIAISKTTSGPAWGAVYWQHFEPLDQLMPGSADLSVQKTLYRQTDTQGGPVITPVTEKTSLKPGDLIKVRLVLTTDRLMEYVHLKDGRASGFEPIAALSGYKYQNGLGYYEAPRDASTDFFISALPVGTHVFEYDLRVAQTGDFSAGVATLQCFYAPEFSAHSAGQRVRVSL